MLAPNNDLKPIFPLVKGQIVEYVQREIEREETWAAQRRWHVLLIEPQHERKAQTYLTAYRFRCYVPTMPGWTTRGLRRVKLEIERPMFPGYLFIRFDPELDDGRRRLRIDIAPGVREFMKLESDHVIIAEDAIAVVQEVERELHDPSLRKAITHGFGLGEEVRISEGPFTGLNASIVRLDDKERITVLLSLLGQAVPTTMPVSDIEKL